MNSGNIFLCLSVFYCSYFYRHQGTLILFFIYSLYFNLRNLPIKLENNLPKIQRTNRKFY